MYCVYILKSEANGSYYVGSTHDKDARLKMHNAGLVKSTKRYMPWDMVYSENHPSLKEARAKELQIKSWKKRSAIERLINSAVIV